jgi:hypothetical protein
MVSDGLNDDVVRIVKLARRGPSAGCAPKLTPFANNQEADALLRGSFSEVLIRRDFRPGGGWSHMPRDSELAELSPLLLCQLEALTYVRNQCRDLHFEAIPTLMDRVTRLGFTELDFVKTLEWVRELAPLIVHVDLAELVDKLAADTHYRNQFETGTSRGGVNYDRMTQVEEALYGGAYPHSSKSERVKYGVLNFSNDGNGVESVARGYGLDYFVLKGVRLRTTLCSGDTWSHTTCGTPDYYAHVLATFADEELRVAIQVARDHKLEGSQTGWAGCFKEVQYHGEIRFKDHIDKIVVHRSRRGKPRFAESLAALQHTCGDCEVLWMDKTKDMERATFVPKSLREKAEQAK